jgi:hypothetical protein
MVKATTASAVHLAAAESRNVCLIFSIFNLLEVFCCCFQSPVANKNKKRDLSYDVSSSYLFLTIKKAMAYHCFNMI